MGGVEPAWVLPEDLEGAMGKREAGCRCQPIFSPPNPVFSTAPPALPAHCLQADSLTGSLLRFGTLAEDQRQLPANSQLGGRSSDSCPLFTLGTGTSLIFLAKWVKLSTARIQAAPPKGRPSRCEDGGAASPAAASGNCSSRCGACTRATTRAWQRRRLQQH